MGRQVNFLKAQADTEIAQTIDKNNIYSPAIAQKIAELKG